MMNAPTKENQATTTETNHTVNKQVRSRMPTQKNKTIPKPIWAPGYPGSGSTLMKNLIRAITGQQASKIYAGSNKEHTCDAGNVVTCHTHWPVMKQGETPDRHKSKFYQSAILMVRNPAKAIPSYGNYMWEVSHKNQKGTHTKQAPEEYWKGFRDQHFNSKITSWRDLLIRWHHGVSYNIALYVPYERMTNETTGPDLLQKLAVLFRDVGATVADDGDMACLWRTVVVDRASVKRRSVGYVPSFRPDQKKKMLDTLEDLIRRFQDQPERSEMLVTYKDDIEKNVP